MISVALCWLILLHPELTVLSTKGGEHLSVQFVFFFFFTWNEPQVDHSVQEPFSSGKNVDIKFYCKQTSPLEWAENLHSCSISCKAGLLAVKLHHYLESYTVFFFFIYKVECVYKRERNMGGHLNIVEGLKSTDEILDPLDDGQSCFLNISLTYNGRAKNCTDWVKKLQEIERSIIYFIYFFIGGGRGEGKVLELIPEGLGT